MDFWQEKVETERFDKLAKDLGVLWVKDEIQARMDTKDNPQEAVPDRVRIPLALSIEPSIDKLMQETFGRKLGIAPPDFAKTGDMVDMFESSREEFMGFVGAFVRPKIVGSKSTTGGGGR